jgi:hypothetical protein
MVILLVEMKKSDGEKERRNPKSIVKKKLLRISIFLKIKQ